jgi:glucan phosphoethanolaminetransferase (alkaline phosphatase superfamily)
MLTVIAQYAKRKNVLVKELGVALAFVYIVFAVLQLVTFEKLPGALAVALPISMAEKSHIMAAVLVVSEVFALPFLLGMQLSFAMRVLSAVLAYVAALYIVFIGYTTYGTVIQDTGLGGGYVPFPGGPWLLWFGIGILVLLGWYTVRFIIDEQSPPKRKHT